MSFVVALPFGIASATVYGASIVVQHRIAQHTADGDDETGGQPSAAGLLRLFKHPIFLLAIAGDGVGFALQIVALTLGSVVVIQPLVVLMLPVALAVGSIWDRRRPQRRDYLGVIGVVAGLGTFLGLVGKSSAGHVHRPRDLALTIALVLAAALVLSLVVTGRNKVIRGAMFGATAGLCFGTLAVMVDAASDRASDAGIHALVSGPKGVVPLIGILVLGGGGIVLTQLSFQVGALNATLPANLAVDPATGVVFGALLLGESVPKSPGYVIAYVACLAAVVAGTIRLARPRDAVRTPETLTG